MTGGNEHSEHEDELYDHAGRTLVTWRLHALWLRLVRGYSLNQVIKRPKANFFGQIVYEKIWVLSRD